MGIDTISMNSINSVSSMQNYGGPINSDSFESRNGRFCKSGSILKFN